MATTVRRAEAFDVPAIVDLEIECFPGDAWVEPYLEIAVDGGMETIRVLAAEVDGHVVGHAIVSVVHEIAELQRIGVTETARRDGVGTELVTASAELAREEGAERLLLEVRDSNEAARRFYEGPGFVEIDRREKYYRDGTTAVILQLDL